MFEPVQGLVGKTINHLGLERQLTAARICTVARQVLADELPRLVKNAEVRSYKNNTLYLYTMSSVASQELFYKEAKFIKLINDKLGKETIKKLNLTLKPKPLD